MIKIFDGAMGTMLQKGGLKAGACPELMNVESADVVKEIHRAYIDAGADIITTNTFGASTIKLAHYGISNRMRELNFAAVKIAKEVAGTKIKVAGDIGPTGKFIAPLGDLDFEDAYKIFRDQAQALADAGADYLIIETCIDIQEMRAALLACHDVCNLPVICQLSYSEGGRTVTGTDAKTAAVILDAMGASIIGVNCSLGPAQLIPVVKILAENSSVPISVQPNAGMPYLENGVTKFPMDAETFGSYGVKLVEAGATYLGGCCGTTPSHIKALSLQLRAYSFQDKKYPSSKLQATSLTLASRSKTVTIDKNLPTVLIGERINPTGRKKLAAEIRAGSLLGVKKDAVNQVKAGAQILDVNMGVGGIDQAAMMKKAVREIAQITDAPIAIDTSDEKALEAALRIFPGRALINSVSYEPARLEKFLPLAKKYGAAILVLPVTEKGVPKTAEERVEVVKKIIDAAKGYGLRDGDFLLDALVMTISADAGACKEVLATLKLYREKFGYPSTMGLSNISFGLPNRPLINSTFFAMSLAAGLDAPIMNPYDELMQNTLKAGAALIGHDANGLAFSRLGQLQGSMTFSTADKKIDKNFTGNIIDAIKNSVTEGNKDGISAQIKQAIDEGHCANEITELALTAAMNELGEDFGAGKIFLPQVLLSAETMKIAFDELKKILPNQETSTQGTFVIATVKGDVHDLGKNIVGALVSNSGFKLIDLGKDVDSAEIVRAAIENDADIVGLCALMTTTMIQIDKVIAELKAAGSTAKVMVGGAALTQEYADAAGADAYAKDGVAAVKLAKKLVS